MRLLFFPAQSKALLRCVRDGACRGRRRTLPTIGLERVHRSSRRDPSWAARHNRRYRVAPRYRALGIPPRHNRAPRESSGPRWDLRDYHGRFWLAVFKSCRGALAADDTAAAPMVFFAGEHAGHGDLPRSRSRTSRPSMESCAIVANQFSAHTHVWPWTQTHSYIKPDGAAGQLIRCHARRAAEAKPMSDRVSLRQVAALMAYAATTAGGQLLFETPALRRAGDGPLAERIAGFLLNGYFFVALILYATLTVLWVWILSFTSSRAAIRSSRLHLRSRQRLVAEPLSMRL